MPESMRKSTANWEHLKNVILSHAPGVPIDAFFYGVASDRNPLHFIKTHLVAAAIIELGSAGARMVCHGRGLLKSAAIIEIGCDARGPEAVIA